MNAMNVPDVLQHYVQRGIFRHLGPMTAKGTYDFVWLNERRMCLQWNEKRNVIVFKDVLHDVPARSKLYRELRAYLKARSDPELPAHRRIDPEAFDLVCENRASKVSVGLRPKAANEEQGVRKLMSVVHEMFLYLHDRWPEYMYEAFGSPLE